MSFLRSATRLTALTCCVLLFNTLIVLFGGCTSSAASKTRSFKSALDGSMLKGDVIRYENTFFTAPSSGATQIQPTLNSMMRTSFAEGSTMNQIDKQKQEMGGSEQTLDYVSRDDQRLLAPKGKVRSRNLPNSVINYSRGQQQAERGFSSGTKAPGSGLDSTFGEEPITTSAISNENSPKKMQSGSKGDRLLASGSFKQKMNANNDQQQVMAEQRAAASKANLVRSQNYVAQKKMNPTASLTNKATYRQMGEVQKAARQPSVMMPVIPNSNRTGNNQKARLQILANAGQIVMRPSGSRKVKQRKIEKRMSPSMVNAILNKMKSAEITRVSSAGSSADRIQMKSMLAAALMKSPARPFTLAKMIAPQKSGINAPQASFRAKGDSQLKQQAGDSYGRGPMATMMKMMLSGEKPTKTNLPKRNMIGNYGPKFTDHEKGEDSQFASDNLGQLQEQTGYEQQQREPSKGDSAMGYADPSMANGFEAKSRLQSKKQQFSGHFMSQTMMQIDAMNKAQDKGKLSQVERRVPAVSVGFEGSEMQQQRPINEPTTTMAPIMKLTSSKMNTMSRGGQQKIDSDHQNQMNLIQQAEQQTVTMDAPMNVVDGDQLQRTIEDDISDKRMIVTGNYAPSFYGRQTKDPKAVSMARPTTMQQAHGTEVRGQQPQRNGIRLTPIEITKPNAFKVENGNGNGQFWRANGILPNGTNGIHRNVEYMADEKGFRANFGSSKSSLSTQKKRLTLSTASGASRSNGTRGNMEKAEPNQNKLNIPRAMTMDSDFGISGADRQQQQQLLLPD